MLQVRIEVGCSLAWGRSCGGGAQEKPWVRGGAEVAAAPPTCGGQLGGDAASPPSALAEEEAPRVERALFVDIGTTLPPRGASPMMLAAQQGIIGITIAIGIGGVAIDSFFVIPCSAGTSPDASCSCRLGEPRAPHVDTTNPGGQTLGERREDPPTPSSTHPLPKPSSIIGLCA